MPTAWCDANVAFTCITGYLLEDHRLKIDDLLESPALAEFMGWRPYQQRLLV
jgi:hypothetical protein